jgi:hypothetical protein
MTLMRKMLLEVEAWPPGGGDQHFSALGQSEEVITYHAYMAIKGGLLDGVFGDDSEGIHCNVFGLTPEGHDFLDSARTGYIWDGVMADLKERGIVSASLDVIKRALDAAIRKRLE